MKASLGFVLLAAASAVLIGLTRLGTFELINSNESQAEARVVSQLLGEEPDPAVLERLCRNKTRGYAGTIELLVLPAPDGNSVQSVRVVAHVETPGIGDFIDFRRSDWILGFGGLRYLDQVGATIAEWDATLDAVSGATITRRALIQGAAKPCQN